MSAKLQIILIWFTKLKNKKKFFQYFSILVKCSIFSFVAVVVEFLQDLQVFSEILTS